MNKINFFKRTYKLFILVLVAFITMLLPSSEVKAFSLTANPTGVCMTYYDDIDSRGFAWQTTQSVAETKLLLIKDDGTTPNWDNASVYMGDYVDFNEYRIQYYYGLQM